MLPQVVAIGVRAAGDIAPVSISGKDEGTILCDRLGPGAFDGLYVAGCRRRRLGRVDLVVGVVDNVIAAPRAGAASVVDRVVPSVLLDGDRSRPQRFRGPEGGPLGWHNGLDVGFEVDGLDCPGPCPQNANSGRWRGRAGPTSARCRSHDGRSGDGGQPHPGREDDRRQQPTHPAVERGKTVHAGVLMAVCLTLRA